MAKETTRIERKKAGTREKIFNTAVKLFLKKGYENTTVDEIVEKADIAKGTFFNYFPKKASLLLYLNQKRVEKLSFMVDRELSGNNLNTKEKILKIARFMAMDNEQNSDLSKYLIFESFKYFGDIAVEDTINHFEMISALAKIIEEGKSAKDVSPKVNTRMLAEILSGTYIYSILFWVSDIEGYSLQQDLHDKFELILSRLL